MKLGQMATINQSIDQDTAMILLRKWGIKLLEKVEVQYIYRQIDSSELKLGLQLLPLWEG